MNATGLADFKARVGAVLERRPGGSPFHYFERTGSTNEEALNLARGGAPHGTLVLADAQTAGRGRHGRTWHSPAGTGLWCSLILRPELDLDQAFLVSACLALALVDTIGRTAGVPGEIRWPNDVLVRGRKIAGLLAEVSGRGGRVGFLVQGFGFNVNQREADFPEDLTGVATSLRLLGGREFDRAVVLGLVLEAFDLIMHRLARGAGAEVLEEWVRAMPMIGRPVRVAEFDGEFDGTARGVSADGSLLVEDAGGLVRQVRAADVRVIRGVS